MADNDSPRFVAVNLSNDDSTGLKTWAVRDTGIDAGDPYLCTDELEPNARVIANAMNAYTSN